jgi:hypothetical protein
MVPETQTLHYLVLTSPERNELLRLVEEALGTRPAQSPGRQAKDAQVESILRSIIEKLGQLPV